MEYAIRLKGLTKSFQKEKVLKNITHDFEKGKIHGIMGFNGSVQTCCRSKYRTPCTDGR